MVAMTDEDKELFIAWTIQKNCYNQMIGNATGYDNVDDMLTLADSSDILSGLFAWGISPQGWDYWYKLSNEWTEYYDEHRRR